MELAQDRVQSQTLVLAMLDPLTVLPECQLMEVVSMGDGWNWCRIVSNHGLWY